MVLTELIVFLAGLIIRIPFSIGGGVSGLTGGLTAASHPAAPPLTATVLSAAGTIISSTVTAPLLAGVVVLLYTDLRMRREGMDITLQAAATEGGEYPAPPSARVPQSPGPW